MLENELTITDLDKVVLDWSKIQAKPTEVKKEIGNIRWEFLVPNLETGRKIALIAAKESLKPHIKQELEKDLALIVDLRLEGQTSYSEYEEDGEGIVVEICLRSGAENTENFQSYSEAIDRVLATKPDSKID